MRIVFTALFFIASQAAALAAEGWIIKQSPHSVAETADRLAAVIEESPATLVARLDHRANAARADLELAPATVLIFGNPALGTPIMQAEPRVGLDLPVKVLVWDDAGQTRIGYLAPDALKSRYSVTGADDAFTKMAAALDAMTDKAAARE